MRTILCALALLVAANVSHAQEKLPDGLRHVPVDALGFLHFRAGDFLKTEVGKGLLEEIKKDREAAKGLKQIEEKLGIPASELESVTLLMLVPPTGMHPGPWGGRTRPPLYGPRPSSTKPAAPDLDMKRIEPKLDREPPRKDFEDKKPAAKESPVVFQERDHWHGPGHDFDDLPEFGYLGPLVIVTATKDLDRKKILRAQVLPGPRDPFGPNGGGPAVQFLTDRTVMLGVPWELARYNELMAREQAPKTAPLRAALTLGNNAHVVAGGHVPAELRRLVFTPFSVEAQGLASIAPLLVTQAGAALHLDKRLDLTLQFTAPTKASADSTVQAVKNLRVLAELGIEKGREAGESGGWKLALENAALKALANIAIEQQGLTVTARLTMEVTPAVAKHFTKEIVAAFRQKGDRSRSANNLKQIGLALHSHHDVFKGLPPAGIGDRDGKPLLSWRVAILPYIEQDALYRQFDLNQPWDHPTNKKLIPLMPKIYAIPGLDAKEGETHYRVFVGNGALFEPRMRVSFAQVPDGLSNTIMVVEAQNPTVWTRPDDLVYDPKGALPKLGTGQVGFNALIGDGSVRFLRAGIPEQTLRAMITRNGGEVIDPPSDR